MNTIEAMVGAALSAMDKEGKVEAIVRQHIEKAIGLAVGEAITGYQAPFNKALQEYVKNALPMNFDRIGLDGYNEAIIAIIKRKLDASLEAWVNKGITEELEELLQPPPESINVSKLVQQLKKTRDEYRDGAGDVTVHIEDSGSVDGHWRLHLDKAANKSARDCSYELAVDDKGKIYSIRTPYRGDITKALFIGPLYDFERTLFRLYAGKTKLILDGEYE